MMFFVSWNESAASWPMPPSGRPLVVGEQALGGVLDDEQVVAARDLHDRVHVAADAGVVDGHDRLRPRGDRRLDPRLVDVQRVGPDVDEDRRRAAQRERVRRRDERERRHDHLVAGSHAAEDRRHLEGRRAGVGEERLPGADPLLEPGAAALGERAIAREMAVRVGLGDVVELPAGHERLVERDHAGSRSQWSVICGAVKLNPRRA